MSCIWKIIFLSPFLICIFCIDAIAQNSKIDSLHHLIIGYWQGTYKETFPFVRNGKDQILKFDKDSAYQYDYGETKPGFTGHYIITDSTFIDTAKSPYTSYYLIVYEGNSSVWWITLINQLTVKKLNLVNYDDGHSSTFKRVERKY